MALLGEGWDDPKSGAITALSAGLLGRNFAGGLLGANQAYGQAKQAQRQAAFDQMKMDAFREELALKKAQAAKKDQGLAMLASVLGTGEPAYQPGQLGSGSFGVVGNADPMAAPARRAGGLANATPEQIAMLKAQGYDLVEPWKVAKQGFEQKPGSFRVDPTTNRREYIEDPKEGYTYRDGRVGNIPGFTEAQMQRTLATEAPKAILQSAGRVNLRTLPDGSQAPVPELSETPMLQDMMRLLYGVSPVPPAPVGGPVNQPPSTPRERVPVRGSGAGDPPAGSGMIAPQTSADRLGILQKSLDQARAGLNAPGVNDMDKSRLMQDIRDIEGEMANMQRVNGRPAPIATAQSSPSQGRYGKTTAQETQEAAKKEYAVGAVKDMVETRKIIMDAGRAASRTIAKYQQLGGLLEGFEGGALTPIGTNIASMANSLGLKIDKNLPNKEAAAALANEIALDMRNPANGAGMPGAMSDKDREFLVSLTPNSGQTAQGRRMIVNSAIAIAKRNEQVAEFARKYEQKYGQLDNDFFSQLSAWSAANPLFKGK